MQKIYEVVQNFWGIISNISKKAYRNCAVIMTGAAVVALISFNSKEFGGSGKNKTDIVQPKNSGILIKEGESGEEELLQQTEEIVSVSVRDTEVFVRESGQTEYKENKEKENNVTESQTVKAEKPEMEEKPVVTEAVKKQQLEGEEIAKATEAVVETDNMKPEPEPVEVQTVQPEAVSVVASTTPVIMLDDTNYQVLLRIVEAEASGEGLEGKKLVANVILNRVKHEAFPGSVVEVVFQKCGGHAQFSPTIDGRFETVTISDETIQAVEMVLNGEDNSQGALFFSARSKADPDNMSWFDENLKWLFAYGGHEFYTLP